MYVCTIIAKTTKINPTQDLPGAALSLGHPLWRGGWYPTSSNAFVTYFDASIIQWCHLHRQLAALPWCALHTRGNAPVLVVDQVGVDAITCAFLGYQNHNVERPWR